MSPKSHIITPNQTITIFARRKISSVLKKKFSPISMKDLINLSNCFIEDRYLSLNHEHKRYFRNWKNHHSEMPRLHPSTPLLPPREKYSTTHGQRRLRRLRFEADRSISWLNCYLLKFPVWNSISHSSLKISKYCWDIFKSMLL